MYITNRRKIKKITFIISVCLTHLIRNPHGFYTGNKNRPIQGRQASKLAKLCGVRSQNHIEGFQLHLFLFPFIPFHWSSPCVITFFLCQNFPISLSDFEIGKEYRLIRLLLSSYFNFSFQIVTSTVECILKVKI